MSSNGKIGLSLSDNFQCQTTSTQNGELVMFVHACALVHVLTKAKRQRSDTPDWARLDGDFAPDDWCSKLLS